MFKMLKKLVIIAINLLVCYLIIKISYFYYLLITKLIVLGIEFKVFKKTSLANNSIIKLEKVIEPN